jgi:hypothetical protein
MRCWHWTHRRGQEGTFLVWGWMMFVPGLDLTDRDVSLLMGWECNIPVQSLIGYSCQQVATYFPEDDPQRTLRLSVLGQKKFWDGWPIRKFFPGAHEWRQSVRKRFILVCDGSLFLKELQNVSGPGLGEAGHCTSLTSKQHFMANWCRKKHIARHNAHVSVMLLKLGKQWMIGVSAFHDKLVVYAWFYFSIW